MPNGVRDARARSRGRCNFGSGAEAVDFDSPVRFARRHTFTPEAPTNRSSFLPDTSVTVELQQNLTIRKPLVTLSLSKGDQPQQLLHRALTGRPYPAATEQPRGVSKAVRGYVIEGDFDDDLRLDRKPLRVFPASPAARTARVRYR